MERERDVDSLIMVLGFCERAKFEMRLVKEEVEFDGDCGVDGVVGDGANTLAKTVVQVVELEGVLLLLVTKHDAFGDVGDTFVDGFSGISSANVEKGKQR